MGIWVLSGAEVLTAAALYPQIIRQNDTISKYYSYSPAITKCIENNYKSFIFYEREMYGILLRTWQVKQK